MLQGRRVIASGPRVEMGWNLVCDWVRMGEPTEGVPCPAKRGISLDLAPGSPPLRASPADDRLRGGHGDPKFEAQKKSAKFRAAFERGPRGGSTAGQGLG